MSPAREGFLDLLKVHAAMDRPKETALVSESLDGCDHLRGELPEFTVDPLGCGNRELRCLPGRYQKEKGEKSVVDDVDIQGRRRHSVLPPLAYADKRQLIPEREVGQGRGDRPASAEVEAELLVAQSADQGAEALALPGVSSDKGLIHESPRHNCSAFAPEASGGARVAFDLLKESINIRSSHTSRRKLATRATHQPLGRLSQKKGTWHGANFPLGFAMVPKGGLEPPRVSLVETNPQYPFFPWNRRLFGRGLQSVRLS